MTGARPALRVVAPDATPDEVAAIVAAIGASLGRPATPPTDATEAPSHWVTTARLAARRTVPGRGEWRFSGRIGHRARV